jgi:hypothetical protein
MDWSEKEIAIYIGNLSKVRKIGVYFILRKTFHLEDDLSPSRIIGYNWLWLSERLNGTIICKGYSVDYETIMSLMENSPDPSKYEKIIIS